MARFLLGKGADIDATCEDGSTPLHIAVQNDSSNVVHFLLENGAILEAKTKDGKTPLQQALRRKIAQMLISKGADKSGIDLNELSPEAEDVEELPW